MGLDARFRLLPPERPAREVEEEMLARWRDEDLFRQVQDARADGAPWVFFEGPPTANGRPGIHHVFARTIKDLFCRHRAMQGYLVPRKAGWDTHGLPVEIEVEKTLPARLAERGMSDEEIRRCSGKQLIEAYGVEEFNRLCRESVFTYRGDWEKLSERIGYWLDYDDPYVTYSNAYVESVWWALKTLHERGLLYRGHKTLPYCGRCGTALSSHELALGYRDVEDPSVYVALDLTTDGAALPPAPEDVVRRRIMVWTTTPWTLPANVALAVHPALDYVEVRKKSAPDWTLLLAEARAAAVLGEGWEDRWDVVHRLTGAQLEGVRYRRPLDWVEIDRSTGDAERIVAEAFVSAEDGTGIVHLAPAFGADDYAAGRRHGLAFVQPVDSHGRFPSDVPVVGGRFVKDGDADIVKELESRDLLWKATRFLHSYPHCWRCGTPLLYVARESWFVRTTAYRERMLSRNRRVDWHPESVGQERFGDWLENNIDWAVSRDRYWGTPLPVWVNDADPSEIEVIGSYAELAAKTGAPLGADFDPHKPFIDRHTWPARSGTGTMRRVPQVIDTWFDSGSMPFAQWHFPFEGHDAFARQYPADFIAEGVDQTRGWFYSLLAIATGLGDALPGNQDGTGEEPVAPYRAVVVNDLVLDANGVKMSKSRGNVVNPWEVVEKYGADAVRLFLVASSQLGMSRKFDESAIHETAARFLVTFKNTYSGMFAQYANFGWSPSDADPAPAERPTIDRWILSRLVAVESEVNARLSVFDATAAARLVMAFIQDDVSNWWVRLNRPRLYDVDSADNRAAFATLHEVLTVCCRLLAPFAPFVSDWVHRELTGLSVHLAPFVREQPGVRDEALEWAMDEIRLLSRLARAAREDAGVKVRQPLATLRCVVPQAQRARVEQLLPLLAAELNVKEVALVSSADSLVTLEAKPNFRALGKKFGKETPLAAKAVAAFSSEALLAFERGEPLAVTVGHETRTLDADDLVIVRRASGELLVKEEDGRFAAIDPTITPALRREGLAREFVSRVQRMRRDAGLAVSDRIRLVVAGGNAETAEAIQEHHDWIRGELLAVELQVRSQDVAVESLAAETVDLDGVLVHVALTREA